MMHQMSVEDEGEMLHQMSVATSRSDRAGSPHSSDSYVSMRRSLDNDAKKALYRRHTQ